MITEMDKEKCETCHYWHYEEIDRGHVCVNPDCDHCGDWREADYGCWHWRKKENE